MLANIAWYLTARVANISKERKRINDFESQILITHLFYQILTERKWRKRVKMCVDGRGHILHRSSEYPDRRQLRKYISL